MPYHRNYADADPNCVTCHQTDYNNTQTQIIKQLISRQIVFPVIRLIQDGPRPPWIIINIFRFTVENMRGEDGMNVLIAIQTLVIIRIFHVLNAIHREKWTITIVK